MKILVTGASSRLAQSIATTLRKDHHVRLMDRVPVEIEKTEFFQGDILDPDDVCHAVRGMDALIHTGALPSDPPVNIIQREQALLDLATRGTHVLFTAAVDVGIKRCLYAGTLAIFSTYPDDVYITAQSVATHH